MVTPDEFAVERLWIVFFRDRSPYWWIDRLLAPGFRHVSAIAYYPSAQRWVAYDPTFRSTAILVLDDVYAEALMAQWSHEAGAIVRMPSCAGRPMCPPFFGCVGAIKALLGIRSGALFPRTLHRHLLARGAEPLPLPRDETVGEPVLQA